MVTLVIGELYQVNLQALLFLVPNINKDNKSKFDIGNEGIIKIIMATICIAISVLNSLTPAANFICSVICVPSSCDHSRLHDLLRGRACHILQLSDMLKSDSASNSPLTIQIKHHGDNL